MSGLKAYLNEHYRSAIKDPRKKEKKKRRPKNASTVVIDEAGDWGRNSSDEDAPVFVPQPDFSEKFKTQTAWEVIQEGEGRGRRSPSISPERGPSRSSPSPSPKRSRRSPSPSPERPSKRRSPSPSPVRGRRLSSPSPRKSRRSPSASPERSTSPSKDVKMADGTRAGLQSGKALAAQLKRQKELDRSSEAVQSEQPATIYRDKTGRKVDIEAQKAELLAARRKRESEQETQMEWGKGLVQKRERDDMKQRLQDERDASFAVYADDNSRNEQLKEKVRWGDTMAAMVPQKKKKKHLYQGVAPPNRYGILPGYRWDGVDRSNGWELKVFRNKHDNAEHQKEYHRWATEDM